ncbi:heterokaryon incompatibility, partial [Tricladium varicosporioides]
DVLQCKFKVVDLNDDPVFEALSYVWGKDGKIVPIQCDGGLISVTPSLANPADSECHQFCEYLWADALCINQDDDDERSQQVGLMRKIYEQAKTVLVMLG